VALAAAEPHRALAVARAQPAVRRAALFGDVLHVTLGSAERDLPALREALAAAGLGTVEAHPVEPSMEDVFIDRVAGAGAA
jgi:hypothetical protein